MRRLYLMVFSVFLATALLMSGCKSGSESQSPIQGKWKVVEVKGANPDIFMNEVWEFKNNSYSVAGLSLGGRYEVGTHANNNTIKLFPNNKTAVRSAGIYRVQKNGKELIMKLGNAENDKPNFPKDFTADIMWYDVYVCQKQ